MSLTMLACVDVAGGLGYQGGLPWHVSAELKHFKSLTMGAVLGVGAGTKLPPLPGRTVVRLSRKAGGMSIRDFGRAYPNGIIIGGAEVFRASIGLVDTIVLSVLPKAYTCDCFMPMELIHAQFVSETSTQHEGFRVYVLKRVTDEVRIH